jgi:hypothetical protein
MYSSQKLNFWKKCISKPGYASLRRTDKLELAFIVTKHLTARQAKWFILGC